MIYIVILLLSPCSNVQMVLTVFVKIWIVMKNIVFVHRMMFTMSIQFMIIQFMIIQFKKYIVILLLSLRNNVQMVPTVFVKIWIVMKNIVFVHRIMSIQFMSIQFMSIQFMSIQFMSMTIQFMSIQFMSIQLMHAKISLFLLGMKISTSLCSGFIIVLKYTVILMRKQCKFVQMVNYVKRVISIAIRNIVAAVRIMI